MTDKCTPPQPICAGPTYGEVKAASSVLAQCKNADAAVVKAKRKSNAGWFVFVAGIFTMLIVCMPEIDSVLRVGLALVGAFIALTGFALMDSSRADTYGAAVDFKALAQPRIDATKATIATAEAADPAPKEQS